MSAGRFRISDVGPSDSIDRELVYKRYVTLLVLKITTREQSHILGLCLQSSRGYKISHQV
jgi:hypothetical protein